MLVPARLLSHDDETETPPTAAKIQEESSDQVEQPKSLKCEEWVFVVLVGTQFYCIIIM